MLFEVEHINLGHWILGAILSFPLMILAFVIAWMFPSLIMPLSTNGGLFYTIMTFIFLYTFPNVWMWLWKGYIPTWENLRVFTTIHSILVWIIFLSDSDFLNVTCCALTTYALFIVYHYTIDYIHPILVSIVCTSLIFCEIFSTKEPPSASLVILLILIQLQPLRQMNTNTFSILIPFMHVCISMTLFLQFKLSYYLIKFTI